uniref:Bifunctional inhibitor/plant lipid transfer protein/seed storage helical domain-containing protein n=1 Tax=Setaria italica TaxID=4555 RepID=K3XNA8_SETIT
MRPLVVLGLVLVVAGVALEGAAAAGECGRASADRVALRLAPCISAADDPQSTPTSSCCSAVHTIGQSPSCLCAVMLSRTASAAGIKPEVAITIPKRCNMADRPVGYKLHAALTTS